MNVKHCLSKQPKELLISICKLLWVHELFNLRQVSKSWLELIDKNFSKEIAKFISRSLTLQGAIERGERALFAYFINKETLLSEEGCNLILNNNKKILDELLPQKLKYDDHWHLTVETLRRRKIKHEFESWRLDALLYYRLLSSQKVIEDLKKNISNPLKKDKPVTRLLKKFGYMKQNAEFRLATLNPEDEITTPSWCVIL